MEVFIVHHHKQNVAVCLTITRDVRRQFRGFSCAGLKQLPPPCVTVRIRSATLQCEAYLLHVRLSFFVLLSIFSLDAFNTAGVVQPSCF